jgi:hypothetical protein
VDLHPEGLFDQLRAGELPPQERLRLEAHCAACAACLFELRWLDASFHSGDVTPDDRARGEAAFDNVLRVTKRSQEPKPSASRHWPLRWGVGGLLLGAGVSVAAFVTQGVLHGVLPTAAPASTSSSRPSAPLYREVRPVEPSTSVPLPLPPPAPRPSTQTSQMVVASAPTADALLAAARHARTRSQLREAAQLYRQVIDRHPATQAASVARVALGRLLDSELSQPRAALALFDAYLRQHRSGELAEEALYYRALSLVSLGQTQKADAGLRELLAAFPNSLYAAPARARLAAKLAE